MNDPIVEEVRKVRREFAGRYDHDIDRICEALRNLDIVKNWPKADLKPPKPFDWMTDGAAVCREDSGVYSTKEERQ